MTELSPAAQAVLDAANASATNAWSDATHQRFRTGVAAALRAAADQLINVEWSCEMSELRRDFHAIATELEGSIT
jgi:hypothetical protein